MIVTRCLFGRRFWTVLFVIVCGGFVVNFGANASRMSGLYVDNGIDQTIVQRVITREEKREVEDEFLQLLGLPDRPKHLKSNKVEKSAPQFLLDVYANALHQDARTRMNKADQFGLSNRDLSAIDQSDVIMTFSARKRKVHGIRHSRGKRIWFDVSEISPEELLLGAELRLYRDIKTARKANLSDFFSISVYRVMRMDTGERELQFVDSVNITKKQGWISLNVTSPLQHWINNPKDNKGLYYSIHLHNDIQYEIKPRDFGLIGFKDQVKKEPFMVAFFKVTEAQEAKSRQKRGAKRRRKSFSMYEYRNPYMDPAIRYSSRTCKLQNLYVSFKDLQWQDWIIAPDGYDAYFCSGECNFPLNAHMNATNHAIVQTLVHLLSPGKVPKPCCAPTKLSSISVLYFLDESNVILKKYKNMVVKSCGCH